MILFNSSNLCSELQLDPSPTYKALSIATYILVLTMGLFLYSGLLHFEKYGRDPQKRSFHNKMLSFLFFLTLAIIISAKTLTVSRVFSGTLPINLVLAILLLTHSFGFLIFTTLCLIIIHYNICLYSWRLTGRLSDDFWADFCIRTTGFLSLLLNTIRLNIYGLHNLFYQILTGDCTDPRALHLPITWWLQVPFLVIMSVLIIGGLLAICWKKIATHRVLVAPVVELNNLQAAQDHINQLDRQNTLSQEDNVNDNIDEPLNTTNKNPKVIPVASVVVLLVIFMALLWLNFTIDYEGNRIFTLLFLRDIVNPILGGILIPGFIYAKNTELRTYVTNGVKEYLLAITI